MGKKKFASPAAPTPNKIPKKGKKMLIVLLPSVFLSPFGFLRFSLFSIPL